MADPLIRTIMNNVARQSGKVESRKQGYNDGSTSNMHISSKEERELLNIIKKTDYKKTDHNKTNYKSNYNSNYNKPKDSSYKRSGSTQKIKLEDLAGNKGKDKTEKRVPSRKNSTMMTLDDLAGKVKKTSGTQNTSNNNINNNTNNNNTSKVSKPYGNKESNYVRSNVISNLEAYVPKVSLNSIGKKGSLK